MLLLHCAFCSSVASTPYSLQPTATVTTSQSVTELALLGETGMFVCPILYQCLLILTAVFRVDIWSGFRGNSALMWFLPHAPRTRASLAAAALAFFSSVGPLFLSHWEHVFSVHPSHLLNIALSVSLLFDIVRVRSLWFASNTAIAGIYTASMTLKIIWFYLEAQSKRKSFLNQNGMERRRSTAYTAAPFFGGSTPISILGSSMYCLWTIYRIWIEQCR